MKLKGLFLLVPLLWVNFACTDQCEATRTYRTAVSEQFTTELIRAGIRTLAPRELKNPAKIYVRNQYIFISEAKKGLHILDNSDPSNPTKLAFIEIPGILDMAIKNQTMYVDSYMDLLALDISDPKNVKEVARVENRFQSGSFDGLSWYYDSYNKLVTDSHWEMVTEKVKTNCGEANYNGGWGPVFYDGNIKNGFAGMDGSGGQSGNLETGKGGSMARFTLYDNYLYTVTNNSLTLYDISNNQKPDSANHINLGWGIETIFPYKDKLFIGSNNGMHIYDNSNPVDPKRLSIFQHARACDPVVVQNDLAYVTLRDGTACGQAPNQLDIVDIKDPLRPTLVKSYPMENPNGLSIEYPNLFLCEGKFGLKSFDVADSQNIKLLEALKDFNAFDSITISDKILMVIGKDGLYQFDYSNPSALKMLSKIPVETN